MSGLLRSCLRLPRMDDNYENHEINLTTHRVTPDNVVELLQNYSTPLDFDVLSLDCL